MRRWWRGLRAGDGTDGIDPSAVLDEWVAPRNQMPADVRLRHTALSEQLVHTWRWEAARGLELTDEMRWTVAGYAALLVTGLGEGADLFRPITSVILHRSTIVRHGPRPGPIPGSITEGPHYMAGEAHHRGPVLLSWGTARMQSRHPERGEHVVVHEMAHRLDMLDGITDGTPPLGDDAELRRRWVAVCTRELSTLRAGTTSPVLRSYAATNPAEFFAVASEVFFLRPDALGEEHPELYAVLRAFYRVDPSTWPTDT